MPLKEESALNPLMLRLKTTDLSSLIRVAGFILPRILDEFLNSLDEEQKKAIDKVMPVGGKKKIYLQLVGTPTPPIVIELAQPVQISTLSEDEVKRQRIKGIKLTIDDIELLTKGLTIVNMLKLYWRMKSQTFTILGITWMFLPLLQLGSSKSKDMGNKLTSKWKPLLDVLARMD